MNIDETALLKAAWAVLDHAHAPYSRFRVGAAIQVADGRIFTGCNVENASYGGTLCAERTAIVKAVSEGALKPGQLQAVLVATPTAAAVFPCGFCRQVIEEFAHHDLTQVLMSITPDRVAQRLFHRDLLPFSFSAKDL